MMDANSSGQQSHHDSRDQPSVINSLIQECSNVTEQIKAAKEKIKRYTIKHHALSTNVLVKRLEFEHDEKWHSLLKKRVEEAIKLTNANQKTVQEFREKRIQERVEKCQEFSDIALNCGNKFKQAHIEYVRTKHRNSIIQLLRYFALLPANSLFQSADNLTKCTRELRQALEVLGKNLSEKEKQLHEYEKRYLESLNKPMEDGVTKLRMIVRHMRSANNKLQENIQSTETQLQVIRNKTKVRKEALAEFKAKKANALLHR